MTIETYFCCEIFSTIKSALLVYLLKHKFMCKTSDKKKKRETKGESTLFKVVIVVFLL